MKLNFTKLFACLLISCLFSGSSMAQWTATNLGTLNPTHTGMGINPENGSPYLIFSGDGANRAQVKIWNGTAWTTVGNADFSAGAIEWSKVMISPAGVPFVAFRDLGNGNKATVMRLNTTSNTWETLFTSEGAATHTTLAFHSTGVPILTYVDADQGNKAVVLRYTGTGTVWEPVGPAEGISDGAVTFTSIALDSDNNLYLAYSEAGAAVVKKFTGSAWETVGGTSLNGILATNTDIAIGPDKVPYLLFRTGETVQQRAARVYRLEGNTWVSVGPATGFGAVNPAVASNAIDWMNIEVDNNNVPFVGMMEGNVSGTGTSAHTRTAVYRFNATTSAWEALGGGPASATVNTTHQGFALDKVNNIAYLSGRDASTNGRPLYVWHISTTAVPTSAARDIAGRAGVEVYPNPSAGAFHFTTAGKFSYTVYNNTGQVMERGKGVGEGKVGTELKAGLYFIKLQTEAGNQTLKLLKQ